MKKWNKELKYINNQNKIIYSIAKKSGLRREINNIKKIGGNDSKKGSDSSSDDSDSDSFLARNSSWYTNRRPAGRKEMNRLDHVVTDNLKNYKYQSNEAISSETTFDTSNFSLYIGTNNPLPLVTVSLRGVK